MKTILLLCVVLTACTAHDVRCDGRLRPINTPDMRTAAAGAGSAVGAP